MDAEVLLLDRSPQRLRSLEADRRGPVSYTHLRAHET